MTASGTFVMPRRKLFEHDGFRVHKFRMHRLDEYCKRMSKDNDNVEFDPNVAAVLRAQGFDWTETPRSIYSVDKLYAALDKYKPGRIEDVSITPNIRQGIALAYACFAKPDYRDFLKPLPLTFDTVDLLTTNKQASSGLTAWGVKKEAAMIRGLERGKQTLTLEKAPEPCIAFARTQFKGKTRLVWGFPYSQTVIEGLVARPLIDNFKDRYKSNPMAFGMSSFELGSKLRVASRHARYAYSTDMTSFDSSVSKQLIQIAFAILKTWFDLTAIEPETGVSYGQVFDVVESYFIHTPIVMPDHNIYLGKRHGVPSGSYFTQMVDSIANVIIGGTFAAKFHMNVNKRDIFVLGDDLMLWSNRNVDIVKLASFASNEFGVEFNPTKSKKFLWSEPVKYLGRWWHKGNPDQTVDQIVARMVYPERHRSYSKDPEKREKEVNLMLAAYAANYEGAHIILKRKLGMNTTLIAPTADDIKVFCGNQEVNPNNLTGLMRFKIIYGTHHSRYEFPTTLVKMWLT